jgi:hypothetical protein
LVPYTLKFESAVNPSGEAVAVLTTALGVPGVTADTRYRFVSPVVASCLEAAWSQFPSGDRSIGNSSPLATSVVAIPVAAVYRIKASRRKERTTRFKGIGNEARE